MVDTFELIFIEPWSNNTITPEKVDSIKDIVDKANKLLTKNNIPLNIKLIE
jgi:hypothetical protein